MKKFLLFFLLTIIIRCFSNAQSTPIVVNNTATTSTPLNIRCGQYSATFLGTIQVNKKLLANNIVSGLATEPSTLNYQSTSYFYKVDLPGTSSTGAVIGYIAAGSTFTNPVCGALYLTVNTGTTLNVRPYAGDLGTLNADHVNINGVTTAYAEIFSTQKYAITGSTTVSGVPWYKIDLPDAAAGSSPCSSQNYCSQSYGWVSGSTSYVTTGTTGTNGLATPSITSTSASTTSATINWSESYYPYNTTFTIYNYYTGSALGTDANSSYYSYTPTSYSISPLTYCSYYTVYVQASLPGTTCTSSYSSNSSFNTIGTAPTASFTPSSTSITTGSTITTTNSTTGTATISYSWSVSPSTGVSFSPSTSSTAPSIYFSYTGTYTVTLAATNSCGTSYATSTVTVNSACSTPYAVYAYDGGSDDCGSTTLYAYGGGSTGSGGTIYYQGTNPSGTSTSYPATSVNITTTSGTYYFRSWGGGGCWSTAGSVTVTINPLPTAIFSVSGGGTYTGATTLTAYNGGSGTIYFQGTTSGGTCITCGGNPHSVSTSGTYYFRARSSAGCWGDQGSADVTIGSSCTGITIVSPPSNVRSAAGTHATFTVGATGTTISYQWYKNTGSGMNSIPGATSSSYTTSILSTANIGYTYNCHLSNSCSAVTTGIVTLNVTATTPPATTIPSDGGACKIIGEPINAATGENFTSHTDISIPDRNTSLNFTRYYSTANNTIDSGMGVGWSHTYNYYVTNLSDTLWVVHFGDGHSSYFVPNDDGLGGSKPVYNGIYEKLSKNISTGIFTLKLKTGEVYLFNSINKLASITDLNGNTTTLNYSGDSLMNVVAPSGRRLVFTYTGRNIASISDTLGRTINYTYDLDSNLISASNPDTGSTKYGYNTLHLLTLYVLPNNDTLFRNYYDDSNRVDSQIDAQHLITQLQYNTPYRGYTTITYPDGSQSIVLHDSLYRLVKETDQLGLVKYTTYDSSNNVDTFKDESNKTYAFAQDTLGNVTKVILPTGITTSMVFDTLCRPLVITDPKGNQDTINYDGYENISKIILPTSANIRYHYDSYGQIDTAFDALNNKTIFGRNTNGDITTITTPSGTKTFEYDAAGRMITCTNENNLATHLYYNNKDKLTKIVDIYHDSVTYIYDANYNLILYTDKMGYQTHWFYDNKDRLIKKINAQSGITTIVYDSVDNVRSVTDPNSHTTNYTYNAKKQLSGISNSLGSFQLGLDSVGNVVSDTDALGNVRAYHFDSINCMDIATDAMGNSYHFANDSDMRLTGITDPMSRTTSYQYNSIGLVNRVTDAYHHPTILSYNLNGQKTSITDPNTHTQNIRYYPSNLPSSITSPMDNVDSFIYDLAGNITTHILPNGVAITQLQDSLNRIKQINVPGNTSYFTYNKNSRLKSYTNNIGTSNLVYDSTNKLKLYADMFGDSVSYTRDSVGNILTIRCQGSYLVTYTYDANNMPLTVTDWLGHVTKYFYDANGRETMQVNTAINDTCKYGYDNAGRRTSIAHVIGSNIIYKRNFTLNPDGEISNDSVLAGKTPKHFHADTVNTDYNNDDGIDRVGSVSYHYDSSGNLTIAGTNHFVFSPDNQLLNMDTSTYYYYDALHNRVKVTRNGVTTIFVLDLSGSLSQVLQEKDSTGAIKAQYIYGNGRLISMIDSAGIHYFLFDESHNTIALANDTGHVTDTYTYLPFGKMVKHIGTSIQRYTFLGQYGVTQENTSIYFMRARYYNTVNHTFLSKDPYPAIVTNPQTLNRYVYSLNNPASRFDPSGLYGGIDYNGVSTSISTSVISNNSILNIKTANSEDPVGTVFDSFDLGAGGYTDLSTNVSSVAEGTSDGASILSTVYSIYKVANEYNKGGINYVDKWDVADASVGLIGLSTEALVAAGLISNPVGWAIGGGVLLYTAGRLTYDFFRNY